jgi:RNA ligase
MNEFQQNLYNDLMNLVETSEAFYFQDVEKDERWYRIFNYRLASYTEFLHPNALECRGHMFEIEKSGSPEEVTMLRLASLPPEKFFNLYENPMTMNLDLSQINLIEDKADGSLISTYIHCAYDREGYVALKTKGSLYSDQCHDATAWLQKNRSFEHELQLLSALGYTINMEWISPTNRIVIGYEQPQLRVLNIRNNMDGSYLDKHDLDSSYRELHAHWIDQIVVVNVVDNEAAVIVGGELKALNLVKFIEMIPEMESIEGFVVRLSTGQRVKIKTKWYLALHHSKDSINSDRRLYEAVLNEATDDLRSLFHDDPVAIARIETMEQFVDKAYNHLVDTVERFYERNKALERKDYAILGQKELTRHQFGLAMRRYLNQEVNYKDFMLAKWKEFGVKDDPDTDSTELFEADLERRDV